MISERLKNMRKDLDLTQTEFGLKLGARQGNVADWERGRSTPSVENLLNIVKTYKINLHWLLTGDGDMYYPSLSEQYKQQEIKKKMLNFLKNELNLLENEAMLLDETKEETWQLPLSGEILAGNPMPLDSIYNKLNYVPIAKQQFVNPNECEAFIVNGNGMEPTIEHSDIVVIKREIDTSSCNNRIVAVRSPIGLILRKLIVDTERQFSCLITLNQKYPIIPLDKDCIMVGYLILSVRQY